LCSNIPQERFLTAKIWTTLTFSSLSNVVHQTPVI
jgi:hypothetical protein